MPTHDPFSVGEPASSNGHPKKTSNSLGAKLRAVLKKIGKFFTGRGSQFQGQDVVFLPGYASAMTMVERPDGSRVVLIVVPIMM